MVTSWVPFLLISKVVVTFKAYVINYVFIAMQFIHTFQVSPCSSYPVPKV